MNIDKWDISVLALYFVALLGTGIYSLFMTNKSTVNGYFLAGRFMTWLPIGASLFASNIGSEHFIGLAGSGAAAGIAVGAFELNAALMLILLGWVFLPVYIASGVCTLPEYMKKRFGGSRIQVYLASISLLLYIFTKISVNLYSGSLFLKAALQWNIWLSISLILALAAVITVIGGLTAVLYTDTLQFFIMVVGALILSILSFIKVGGFKGLLDSYGSSITELEPSTLTGSEMILSLATIASASNVTDLSLLANSQGVSSNLKCILPSQKAFILLRGITDTDMPWLGFLLGQTPSSIWYWCADQMMVQRTLSAKSLSHAQGATLMTGIVKQLPLFVLVFPGMISRVLFPNEIGCLPGDDCVKACNERSGCSNFAYPKLIVSLMPSGLRGLMLAVMLAALITDLTSIFNSASTLFTVDIYQRIRSKAKNMELMIVGRVSIVVLVLLSIAWIPIVQNFHGSQLYIYIQAIAAFLSPPIASVYLCALLWKRCNEKGAFGGLIYGLLIGMTRMILSIVFHDPLCIEEDTRPWILAKFHYLYFSMFSFGSTAIITIVISLLSKAPTEAQLHRLTFWTAYDSVKSGDLSNADAKYYTSINDNPDANPIEYRTNPKSIDASEQYIISGDYTIREDSEVSNQYNLEPQFGRSDICSRRFCKQLCLGFCGCANCPTFSKNASGEPNDRNFAKSGIDTSTASQEKRLLKIKSLHQNPRAKIGLRIGVIGVLILSIFGFVFFSIFFKEIPIGPIPVRLNSSTLSNHPNGSDLIAAIEKLQAENLVCLVNKNDVPPAFKSPNFCADKIIV